jgi:hypothetical protein
MASRYGLHILEAIWVENKAIKVAFLDDAKTDDSKYLLGEAIVYPVKLGAYFERSALNIA